MRITIYDICMRRYFNYNPTATNFFSGLVVQSSDSNWQLKAIDFFAIVYRIAKILNSQNWPLGPTGDVAVSSCQWKLVHVQAPTWIGPLIGYLLPLSRESTFKRTRGEAGSITFSRRHARALLSPKLLKDSRPLVRSATNGPQFFLEASRVRALIAMTIATWQWEPAKRHEEKRWHAPPSHDRQW